MDRPLDQTGEAQPDAEVRPDQPDGALTQELAGRASAVVDEVRDRIPQLVDAGGRAIDQVVGSSPAAIDASIDMIDRSSTTALAVVTGVCAGLSAGLLMARAPRVLGLLVGAMALVLGGTLLGRRGIDAPPWD
jgi:hypothetical protein